MSQLFSSALYSLRALFKRPALTFVGIFTLAVGMGAATSIYSVVRSVLLKPLPYAREEQLYFLLSVNLDAAGKLDTYGPSLLDYLDWKERSRSFQSMAAMLPVSVSVSSGQEVEQIDGGRITPDLFSVLGAKVQKGRGFTKADTADSGFVVLSHKLAIKHFETATAAIGKILRVDGVPHTVVGVMPSDFFVATEMGLWLPMNLQRDLPARAQRTLYILGRLANGISEARAADELQSIALQLAKEYPDTNKGWDTTILSVKEQRVREIRPTLFVLSAAVFLLLLISIANTANLMLTRVLERKGEFALRTVLGASRRSLILLLCVENILLAMMGGFIGLLLAFFTLKPMLKLSPMVALGPNSTQMLSEVSMDWHAALFNVALSIVTGLIIGVTPLFRRPDHDLHSDLRESSTRTSGSKKSRLIRSSFVFVEVALAVILLVGAAQMLLTLKNLEKISPGFQTQNGVTMRVSLPVLRYGKHEERAAFAERALNEMQNQPGVLSAAITSRLPLNEFALVTRFIVEDRPSASEAHIQIANFRRISPKYFSTMGVPLLEGRDFAASDRIDAAPVTVVSKHFANRYWPGRSAIGKRIKRLIRGESPWITIVGVMGDIKDGSLTGENQSVFYVPYSQQSFPQITFVVRTSSSPLQSLPFLQKAIRSIDPELPPYDIKTLDDLMNESLSKPRFTSFLTALFAISGLLLAIGGVYGTIAYSVSRSYQEIGIRMALGAGAQSIMWLVLKRGILIAAAAGVFGSIISALLTNWTASVFPGFVVEPLSFLSVPVFIVIVAAAACCIPARKAIRISPVTALRYD